MHPTGRTRQQLKISRKLIRPTFLASLALVAVMLAPTSASATVTIPKETNDYSTLGEPSAPSEEATAALNGNVNRSARSGEYNGMRFYDVDNTHLVIVRHEPAQGIPGNPLRPVYDYRPYPFAKAVYWMVQEKISTGTRTTTRDGRTVQMFYPGSNLSRAAMASFMYRKAGSPSFRLPSKGFSDVPTAHKFYRAIMWMKATGLSTGYADGTYQPEGSLSRGAMAAFLYRQQKEPGFLSSGDFTDSADSRFARAIQWMKTTSRSTGFADGSYRPYASITREAMAAFMYRDAGSPWMPTIPADVILTGVSCGVDTVTYRRSLGWTSRDKAIADAKSQGCKSWG